MKSRLLIIEDDREYCEEIREILMDEGYDVNCVYTGLDGLKEVKKNNYDMLLLDLKIPGIKGMDILDKVKKKKPGIKVIIMTGDPIFNKYLIKNDLFYMEGENEILRKADFILNKPFNVDNLLDIINKTLH